MNKNTESLLIATANRGKFRELAELLKALPWVLQGLNDFPAVPAPIEDGDTFEANALKKARYYSQCFGLRCVADDSGLVVDALGGAPGVFSARYAGEPEVRLSGTPRSAAEPEVRLSGTPRSAAEPQVGPQDHSDRANNEKLLAALAAVAEPDRTARFVCCAATTSPDGACHVEMDAVEGRIAFAPRGNNGFGYDPLFIPEGYQQTFGELPISVKLAISHRARAFRKLSAYLESLR